MRLFLSSFRLVDDADDLLALVGHGARVAITANAMDALADFPRDVWVKQESQSLARRGFRCSALDLRDYYRAPRSLRAALDGVDLVWATGGNAFVLRDALRRSGLDDLLLERLGDDSVAYGGFSAGCCICGPTLHGFELVDDVRAVAQPVWDGLGLVEFSPVPHYRSEHAEANDIERVVAYLSGHGMPFRVLSDGQALVIQDDSVRLVYT